MERLSYVFTKGRMEPEEYDQRYDVLEKELSELKDPQIIATPKSLPCAAFLFCLNIFRYFYLICIDRLDNIVYNVDTS